jgi:hypothetical protein
MPEGHQDHGGVAMSMPIVSGRLHEPFDLALGKVLAGAIFRIRQPTRGTVLFTVLGALPPSLDLIDNFPCAHA